MKYEYWMNKIRFMSNFQVLNGIEWHTNTRAHSKFSMLSNSFVAFLLVSTGNQFQLVAVGTMDMDSAENADFGWTHCREAYSYIPRRIFTVIIQQVAPHPNGLIFKWNTHYINAGDAMKFIIIEISLELFIEESRRNSLLSLSHVPIFNAQFEVSKLSMWNMLKLLRKITFGCYAKQRSKWKRPHNHRRTLTSENFAHIALRRFTQSVSVTRVLLYRYP